MSSLLSSDHDSPSTRTLRAYGWDEFFENAFTGSASRGLVPARTAARSDARLRAERENHRRPISRCLRAAYSFRGRQR